MGHLRWLWHVRNMSGYGVIVYARAPRGAMQGVTAGQ
jgi:hypothetical protein